MKPMTLRLSDDQHAALAAVARADGISMAEAVRAAIDEHIATRRQDTAFRERIATIVERDRELLDRLAR